MASVLWAIFTTSRLFAPWFAAPLRKTGSGGLRLTPACLATFDTVTFFDQVLQICGYFQTIRHLVLPINVGCASLERPTLRISARSESQASARRESPASLLPAVADD